MQKSKLREGSGGLLFFCGLYREIWTNPCEKKCYGE